MGDGRLDGKITVNPVLQDGANRLREELPTQSAPTDLVAMSTVTKAARVGQVTAEGLAHTPAGIVHAVENAFKPENFGKDLELIGTSAVLGFGLRTLLPKTGALATTVGVVMGAMFVKDAAMPMMNAWRTVTTDGSQEAMSTAARKMGDGLGEFVFDGGVSLVVAGGAAKATPGLWNRFAPSTWAGIESFKATHLSDASHLGLALGTLGEGMSAGVNKVANKLDPHSPRASELPASQLVEIAEQVKAETAAATKQRALYRRGMKGADGYSHGHERTIDLLLAGADPRVVPAHEAEALLSSINGLNLAEPRSMTFRKAAPGEPPTAHSAETPVENVAPTPQPPQTEAQRILNFQTMSAQAEVVKAAHESVSAEQGIVLDAVNRTTGAVHVRTNPAVKPLLGYGEPHDAMLAHAEQIKNNPQTFEEWRRLFEQFGDASIQSGTAKASDVGAHIARFNEYARTNVETYRRNIIQAGIDERVALQRKVVSPLGEATSDVEITGRKPDGSPIYEHQGPFTDPAIYGPNGEPIWPIDLVKIPLRDLKVRTIQTPGDYGHELMHDQFGRMGAFDPTVREAKLGEAAERALGADASKVIKIPNGGIEPQQVLLNNIARQAGKLKTAQEKLDFLTKELSRDTEHRTTHAQETADALLGENSDRIVQIRGQGKMPLNELIANIAVKSDARTPEAVLSEALGKGDAAATAQQVRASIDSILGKNGSRVLTLADGTTKTLAETIAEVSDKTRNPHFETHGEALPATMTYRDLLVNIAKGWADETFADWGAAAESGQFSVLGEEATLSSRTLMGQANRAPDNPLGIEVHPVEKLRPRYYAHLIRSLATAKGARDPLLLDWADALEKYSRDASKPGDIVIASMDAPRRSIRIPEAVFDKFIPELVDQQINTPLPRLQGHTLFEILPDLRKNFRINERLSNQWVGAIKNGVEPASLPFDVDNTKITHVFGAGQPTFLKLVADGMDPIKANDAVNKFADYFGNKFLEENPHGHTTFATRLQLAPRQTLAQIPDMIGNQIGGTIRTTYPFLSDTINRNSLSIAGSGLSHQLQKLIDGKP